MSTEANPRPSVPATVPSGTGVGSERPRSLDELIAEQGVKPLERFEDLFGAGADLWSDEAEFEQFLESIRESRRTGG
jgi:hypothetical protein